MSLFTASLNSGSNGNCYYIGHGDDAVLVDAGISCRETEKRMKRAGLRMEHVKALFISHEHGDHIRGVEGMAAKHHLPVYITAATLQKSRLRISSDLVRDFAAYQPVAIGGLSVTAFPKLHDAADPHSFIISGYGATVGVFTDIGYPCPDVVSNFRLCNAVFLEANYDEHMLENGRYNQYLKQRIRGGHGHLSNRQALELFLSHRSPGLSQLYLSHLSKENNCPELAYELFLEHAGHTHIAVASRYEQTSLFEVAGTGNAHAAIRVPAVAPKAVQISLFA